MNDQKYAIFENNNPEPTFYTGEQVLKEFYPFWSERMKSLNKEHLISEQNCIDDWATINWAWKVDETNKAKA